jgi:hypothetical protein
MGKNLMIVRKMTPHEIDVTINLFGYYRDEAIEKLPKIRDEYDEDSVLQTIRLMSSNYEYCWFNIYDNSRPVGFVAGYVSCCPWNREKVIANIQFIYLLKSHRNMDNFKQLLGKFEEWAGIVNAQEITAGDIGIDIERSKTLYEHFNFKPQLFMSKEIA